MRNRGDFLFQGDSMAAETSTFWALGVLGISGKLLGMPVDLLLLGGVIGAAMLGRHRATMRINGAACVLFSAVLAASLAPYLPDMLGMNPELSIFFAIVIAAAWPYAAIEGWPMVKAFLSNWTGRGNKP